MSEHLRIPVETSQRALQLMFQYANIGIAIVNEQGVIEQTNPYFSKLFGYKEGELLGKTIEALLPQRLSARHAQHRASYHKNPKARPMGSGLDLWALRKDGSEFPVEVSLAHYEINGQREVVSFVNDITHRRRAEEALKKLNIELEKKVEERTQELSQALLELHHINSNLQKALEKEKELSELKSRFVSMASHEFRTPLGGILSSAALIGHYNQACDEEKRCRHLNTIKALVKNLTSILNDFLSLDKLEGGKIECCPSVFNLKDFIQDLNEQVQALAKKDQRIFFEQNGEGEIFTDRSMLQNVLINLLSNAVKYSPTDGAIHFSAILEPNHVFFMVSDQGIGIPEVEQNYLFEQFFRASNALTVQGTGLGLTIIKRYLDLMQGSIEFTSQENVGSTFTVILSRELQL